MFFPPLPDPPRSFSSPYPPNFTNFMLLFSFLPMPPIPNKNQVRQNKQTKKNPQRSETPLPAKTQIKPIESVLWSPVSSGRGACPGEWLMQTVKFHW